MKKLLVILAVFASVGGLLWFVTKRKGLGLSNETTDVFGGCIARAPFHEPYEEWEHWWSALKEGLKKHAKMTQSQIDNNGDDLRTYVLGFFKAINVKPTASAVKYYKEDIRKWLETGGPRSWEVQVGAMACG